MRRVDAVAGIVLAVGALAAVASPVAAHASGVGGTTDAPPVPAWLVLLTGGGIVGASFLFTSFMTDHALIRAINGWGVDLPTPATVRTRIRQLARAASVAVLGLIVVTGLVGPRESTRSFAVLVVWAGWWAAFTMSVYLVGNAWPLVDPWRALARALPSLDRQYPERLGAWPAVAGLLVLVWVEVVSPVAESPRLLAGVVLAYTAVTLAGAAAFGAGMWFGRVDPIANVFRWYGRLAPLQRTDDGIEIVSPGTGLVKHGGVSTGEAAFVVALLWVTTYDGIVSTPTWAAAARPLVAVGVPALLLYLAAVVAGFGCFLWLYRLAARLSRRTADSYVTVRFVRRWFVPSLVPIAAGYHLAHFLGYAIALSPALLAVAADPLSPPETTYLAVLPDWFGAVQLTFVLLGHVLAIWIAHALAFELFAGRLQPIRSQYPFVVVMILYTVTSMWIVAQPSMPPPFL